MTDPRRDPDPEAAVSCLGIHPAVTSGTSNGLRYSRRDSPLAASANSPTKRPCFSSRVTQGPTGGRGGVQVHAVAAQILAAALESVGHLGVARDRGSDGLGG